MREDVRKYLNRDPETANRVREFFDSALREHEPEVAGGKPTPGEYQRSGHRDNEGLLSAYGITGCGCWACVEAIISKRPWPDNLMFPFIVCDTCGNKRCPHAEQHDLTCTGSNDPGQPGATRYRILTDEEQEAARRAFWEEDDD